jgi:hypothetical protein
VNGKTINLLIERLGDTVESPQDDQEA